MANTAGKFKTFKAGEALTKYRLVKHGSSAGEVLLCDAGEKPIGVATKTVASGSYVEVELLNAGGSVTCEANAAVAWGARVSAVANGLVDDTDGNGAFGIAIQAASDANERIEVLPLTPAEAGVLNVGTETLTAARTITLADPNVLFLDPGGSARVVLLPTEATSNGRHITIINTADMAEALTVKEDSSTTTIVTIAQNEGAELYCDGTSWKGIVGANT